MKRYQVQFKGFRGTKALMDTDDYEAARRCLKAQAPMGWIIDTAVEPEKWIED